MDLVVQGDLPLESDPEIGFVPARDAVSIREHPRAGLAYRHLSPCAPAYGSLCLPCPSAVVEPTGQVHIPPPPAGLFDVHRALGEEFFYRRPSTLGGLRVTARAEWARVFRTPRVPADAGPGPRAAAFAFLLRRLAADAREVGAEVMVVHLPYLERGTTNDPPGPLLDALSRLGDERAHGVFDTSSMTSCTFSDSTT